MAGDVVSMPPTSVPIMLVTMRSSSKPIIGREMAFEQAAEHVVELRAVLQLLASFRQQLVQIGAHLLAGVDVVLMHLRVVVQVVEHVVLRGARPAEHRGEVGTGEAEILAGQLDRHQARQRADDLDLVLGVELFLDGFVGEAAHLLANGRQIFHAHEGAHDALVALVDLGAVAAEHVGADRRVHHRRIGDVEDVGPAERFLHVGKAGDEDRPCGA